MCCYDWIDVWIIMNMYVWGPANDEGVKAWVLLMIKIQFVVEFDEEIAMNYDKIGHVYVDDFDDIIHC